MSRLTPDQPDEDDDLLARLVCEAGDPKVVPRPEHVAELRARLLDRLGPRRRARSLRTRWLVGSGLAAACLLAVLAWPRRGDTNRAAPQVALRPLDVSSSRAAWLETRRSLDGTDNATFNWPLQETVSLMVSSPIPADLLD